ncbi:class I glutamine amidotransferase-like protein [Flagelloscypha sp. PMI_526]|nr:class I glutamine amidotransferase-like protein [Flagelloscypha sp. PMI_526]
MASTTEATKLTKYGVVLYPGFQALDVFGPLDALNVLADKIQDISLSILAESLDPVSTARPGEPHRFAQSVVPTHTFATAPGDLEVLLIPGGIGARDESIVAPVVAFIKDIYPKLKYVVTICTGSGVAAKAGILDGRRATTNKKAFNVVKEWRSEVQWVKKARWVVDGNIWTGAGVSAGIDTTFAFIGEMYGESIAQEIADHLEYERHTDSSWDPYADLYP